MRTARYQPPPPIPKPDELHPRTAAATTAKIHGCIDGYLEGLAERRDYFTAQHWAELRKLADSEAAR